MEYVLPIACPRCSVPAGTVGYAEQSGPQLIGRCPAGHYVKCVPKTESGAERRSVSTRKDIKPNQKARILFRANGRCELCGASSQDRILNVGHLISVKDGFERGLTEAELNDDENLCAMCEECNLGLGPETVPLRYVVNLLMARLRTGRSNGSQPGGRPNDAA